MHSDALQELAPSMVSCPPPLQSVFSHIFLIEGALHTHTPLLVKRVNWGYLYTPIQTGTFECGYTPAYWGYTKYECDYTPITWGYPNAPSIRDMLLNAFIWHFWSHAGNAQMGTSPVGSVSTFPLAESDVCPRFTPFTKAHPHTFVITFKRGPNFDFDLILSNRGHTYQKSIDTQWTSPRPHTTLSNRGLSYYTPSSVNSF